MLTGLELLKWLINESLCANQSIAVHCCIHVFLLFSLQIFALKTQSTTILLLSGRKVHNGQGLLDHITSTAVICYNVLRIPVHGLKRDQEYSTMVVAYNNNTSLKSKKVYFCKLIVITSFLHT